MLNKTAKDNDPALVDIFAGSNNKPGRKYGRNAMCRRSNNQPLATMADYRGS